MHSFVYSLNKTVLETGGMEVIENKQTNNDNSKAIPTLLELRDLNRTRLGKKRYGGDET